MQRAFTLIELLIVVAIIAILAAIAVPNFLEAQTRSKVSRVKADMRALGTGLEAYFVDNNAYPPGRNGGPYPGYTALSWPIRLEERLSTPVAYFSSVGLEDPFNPHEDGQGNYTRASFQYHSFANQELSWWRVVFGASAAGYSGWHLCSWGPDSRQNASEWLILTPAGFGSPSFVYDPTNGTVSGGDVPRFGGAVPQTPGVTACAR
jgi:prepilin-type N-terminal cleavage/methylation domain-containing protein